MISYHNIIIELCPFAGQLYELKITIFNCSSLETSLDLLSQKRMDQICDGTDTELLVQ